MPASDRPAPATIGRLVAPLRAAPATVPALAALVLMVVWAADQAGYPLTHWAPGGLIVLALLAIALAAGRPGGHTARRAGSGSGMGGLQIIRPRFAEIPAAVRVALLCLAAYTALSFLSIAWAAVPGDAWEGADRTLLYLLVFALFACWPQRGASAALLLCAWTLAMVALAAFAALHVDAAATSPARLAALLPGGRLVYPAGYANAAAAQWLIAFWPAVLLARGPRLPWGLRGTLAGGAVLLAGVALLSQSRGSLYATPVLLVLVFALLPGRVRTFALLVPVAAGIAAAAPAVLRVGERLTALEAADFRAAGGAAGAAAPAHAAAVHAAAVHAATTAVHGATVTLLVCALAVGLVVAAGAAVESRRALSPSTAARLRRGVGAVAAAALVAVLAGGLVAAGNPVTRVRHAWDTFKSPAGYEADGSGGSRLTSGLGSNRYDFYRVAVDQFAAHPLLGIGADNFAEQYLARGRSGETPRYPHSVELRTLAQTGLLGALLAVLGLGAALLAAWRAIRGPDPLARTVAAAAAAGFAYWVVHGSFDWFWEFAGLGAPAFAMLGLACALAPRAPQRSDRDARRWVRRCAGLAGLLVALAAAVSLTAPWLSELQVQSAARVWTRNPRRAYALLDDAARLNPLGDEPYVVAGSIALRLGETGRADREFALALRRTPDDAYATLERGAIASAKGDRRRALALLGRAARLNPRDPLTREALLAVRRGETVDIGSLNSSILHNARQLF
jgi:tetratricopeptide (TPR) repeat protein